MKPRKYGMIIGHGPILYIVLWSGMVWQAMGASISALVESELSDNIELVSTSDPRYAQMQGASEVVFAEPDKNVAAYPKLAIGPAIYNNDEGSIVTFKAAKGECAYYAIAPTEQALKDAISISFVHSTRLPTNSKWELEEEDEIFKFQFTRPITIQYNDAGYSSTDGGMFAKDTNRNFGFRLYKVGKLLTQRADYEKYVRHMIASNPKIKIASNVSLDEAELLIKWGLADEKFSKHVYEPLRRIANAIQASAVISELDPTTELLLAITTILGSGAAGVTLALLTLAGFGIYYLAADINPFAKYKACDSKTSLHQSTDLRDNVILAK